MFGREILKIYGISQNPDTNDYILVQNWTSGNEKIDDFILEMQLNINNYNNRAFEWIPYNQFNEIKETSKDHFTTVYSAIWRDGLLYHEYKEYKRDSSKEVALKYLNNSHNSTEILINEV